METEKQNKPHKHYLTRKNFIAISLVALFSILMMFVAVCLDRSENAMMSAKNPIAMLAGIIPSFYEIEANIGGIVYVALFAIYALVFTIAFIYEKRYANVGGKSAWSVKMILIYLATLVLCLGLSVGLGLLIAPTDPELGFTAKMKTLFDFLLESLTVTVILYAVLAILVGAVMMFIVNFRKVNKPFEFFGNSESLAEVLEDEEPSVSVAESFDVHEEIAAAQASPAVGGVAGGVVSGASVGVQPLEDREKVFPALSKIDENYQGFVAEELESVDVTLKQLCEGFRNYLNKYEKLYFDIDTIRMFICGLNATRLILLEGLSGTGKSSLPRYFAKYVQGSATFLAVQATWRDRTNLLGYFNDFSKTYAETDFLTALYEANYDEDRINIFVLDELNISRVEYYFADFLSVLEYPQDEWKLRIMQLPIDFLPPVKLEDGYVRIPKNAFFVGTANKDDSTFSIADKVYDRSIPIEFDNLNMEFEADGDAEPITLGMSKLQALFDEAASVTENAFTREDTVRFSRVIDFLYDTFDVALGNRVLNQISALVPAYIACGGTKEEVLDFILARKVLVKLEGRFEDYIKDGLKQLLGVLESTYGAGTFPKSEKVIENLMKKL